MPDENKLKVMRERGVRVQKCCATCAFFAVTYFKKSVWSTCGMATYTHQKHTDKTEALPVHMVMVCPDHEYNENQSASRELGRYKELLETEEL